MARIDLADLAARLAIDPTRRPEQGSARHYALRAVENLQSAPQNLRTASEWLACLGVTELAAEISQVADVISAALEAPLPTEKPTE